MYFTLIPLTIIAWILIEKERKKMYLISRNPAVFSRQTKISFRN